MAITSRKITAFANLIANLADQPNTVYSAAQLKAYFDSSPEELRVALVGLIDDLLSTTDNNSGADNIGATSIAGLTGNTVQSLLEALKTLADTYNSNLINQITNVVLGQIPNESLTDTQMSADLKINRLYGVRW